MVEPRRRQERAEHTRTQIIDAAASAFAEHGYDGVSLNSLVEASGVSKGAFYFHFSSKEELALAAFLAKQRQLLEHLSAGDRALGQSAGDRLATMLRRRNKLIAEDPSFACVTRLGNEMTARSAPGSPYATSQEEAIRLIAGIVEAGQRRHDFRPGLDPQSTARSIFAWVTGIDALSLSTSGGEDLQQRSEEMLALLLPAMLVAPHPVNDIHPADDVRPLSKANSQQPQRQVASP
ncbi:MAG: TetR family transcriptional regulator [Nocardioidaceae bacterium]